MRVSLSNLTQIADMTGASNQIVSKIATAALEDFVLVSFDNPVNVVDKNKISRELYIKKENTYKKRLLRRKNILK